MKFLHRKLTVVVLLLVSFALPVFAANVDHDQEFQQLADEYIDTVFLPANPTQAVQLGVHQFDNQLENFTQTGFEKYAHQLQQFRKRVQAVNAAHLNEMTRGDRLLILNNINSQLLSLQNIRMWQKNPDYYSSGITTAAFVIMERPFAPAPDRLRALIAREKAMPAALEEARKNLVNPPKIYTEIALEQMPGMIAFFKNDVPKAFASVKDPALKKEFDAANAAVISALQSYQTWMQSDLLPRSNGDFRFWADNLTKKLKYDEMVDVPLPRLLTIGWDNLRQNQKAYDEVLTELANGSSTEDVLKALKANHPAPDQLLKSFSSTFSGLIDFIKTKKIITIPSDVRPTMEETPPFMRATTFASMDTPGPFENTAKEAFFNVTLPEASWDKAKVNDFMGMFNYPSITAVSVHESYPGHYVQFLWMHQINDRVRKIFGSSSNAEGWAHYSEQMMMDEGLGQSGDARQAKLMKLGQLQNALMRNARFIVAIMMHTGKMTFDQAVDFFVKEGKLPRSGAIVEAKRGTADATYLYYTLGKLQILKLRADLQAKEGKDFNLEQFHNDFMRQGFPPIKIVRRALLHDDSPTL